MLPAHLAIPDFEEWGMTAFTTSRAAGTFGTQASEAAEEVFGRWNGLIGAARDLGAARFGSGFQVHGADIARYGGAWSGWLRSADVDGHLWLARGTAAAVTIADCVPVVIGHPSGAGAVLHSGWRGTVAGITERAIAQFGRAGFGARSLRIHLGPSICGTCYEVIADRARRLGVRDVAISEWCTRCSNDQLFSHRAGDAGRQLGVLISPR
jgi:copper oxidase (laccase) domain-containing protein